MPVKDPVLLTVLIETAQLRWYVAGIELDGEVIPLLQSEAGNLDAYIGVGFDEQTSFLRHRLSGVLQRGVDRLWGKQKKACQIVFLVDGPFIRAEPGLTKRVAEHFVQWMTRPPVAFLSSANGLAPDADLHLSEIAGDMEQAHRESLDAGLPDLLEAMSHSDVWELSPSKSKK